MRSGRGRPRPQQPLSAAGVGLCKTAASPATLARRRSKQVESEDEITRLSQMNSHTAHRSNNSKAERLLMSEKLRACVEMGRRAESAVWCPRFSVRCPCSPAKAGTPNGFFVHALRALSRCIAACKYLVFVSILFPFVAMGQVGPSSADSRALAAPVKVNRTVPKVEPPKTGLQFSASPTTQEIFRARVFEEPLVPIGGEPGADENAALAAALVGYAKRSGPDDFASLTGFLEKHPQSPWRAALLTGLGLEYYNTAHYSLALEAWEKAWPLAKEATDHKGKAIADRAAGELAYMYARLGRMTELEALLKSVESRAFIGAATERITGAGEGLWNMQNKPEISFKCGPYALQQILKSDQSLLTSAATNALIEIFNSASTQQGCSLPQVAELSKKVGLNYQMAFRTVSESRTPDIELNISRCFQSFFAV